MDPGLLAQLCSAITDSTQRPFSLGKCTPVGGTASSLYNGTPTIFDPAVYYGDRECDIAMTKLFGGYSNDFYTAYNAAYPLDTGYATRRELYNLYHVLNHANLFGGGYARLAEVKMQRLLATTNRKHRPLHLKFFH
jgi:protein-ribulosamine 3-kinase